MKARRTRPRTRMLAAKIVISLILRCAVQGGGEARPLTSYKMDWSPDKLCDALQNAPDEGDETWYERVDDVEEGLKDGEDALEEALDSSNERWSRMEPSGRTWMVWAMPSTRFAMVEKDSR